MSLDISLSELIGWAITLLGIFTTLVFGLVKLVGWVERSDTHHVARQVNRHEHRC